MRTGVKFIKQKNLNTCMDLRSIVFEAKLFCNAFFIHPLSWTIVDKQTKRVVDVVGDKDWNETPYQNVASKYDLKKYRLVRGIFE